MTGCRLDFPCTFRNRLTASRESISMGPYIPGTVNKHKHKHSRKGTHRGTRANRAGQQDWATLQDQARLRRASLTSDTNRSTATTAVVLLLPGNRLADRSRRLGHNRGQLVRVWSGGGIARVGRGSRGEGKRGGEDESGVMARVRVRVRARTRARHSSPGSPRPPLASRKRSSVQA